MTPFHFVRSRQKHYLVANRNIIGNGYLPIQFEMAPEIESAGFANVEARGDITGSGERRDSPKYGSSSHLDTRHSQT